MPVENQADKGPLSLTSLEVENVLRLKAVRLTMEPGGALILEGKNEQGKSSVLRSLEILLAGMSETPDEPLHGDAKEGQIVATFGDIVVTKTFKHGRSPALSIHREGKRQTAPQTLLNELLDRVSLDPLKFMNADESMQLRMLSDIMGFDSAPFDLRYDQLYAKRRDANRDVKRLRIELDAVEVHKDAPDEEVDVAELTEELRRRRDHNSEIAKAETFQKSLDDEAAKLLDLAEETESEIKALQEKIAKLSAELNKMGEKMHEAKRVADEHRGALAKMEFADEDEIVEKMANADNLNRKFRDNQRHAELAAKLSEAKEVVNTLEDEIKDVEREREEARLKARENLPVPELDITKDSVLYRGKPLAQAGSSAELRVSVAVALAVNKDKRIKLLLIDDAEKLDTENTQVVLEMAREAGFQVLMARVGEGGDGTVLIEDGEVKE